MNVEQLKSLVEQGYSTRKIAKKIGKSQTTVRYWLKKINKKTKTTQTRLVIPDYEIKEAINNSDSVAETLRTLKKAIVGANYKWLYREAKRMNVSLSHFKGKAHGRSKQKQEASLNDIFVKNSTHRITSSRKRKLFNEGLLVDKCQICNLKPLWNGKPLTLRLDHINGNTYDHRVENLRLVCPNCDSQLPTYCGRNIKNKHRRSTG